MKYRYLYLIFSSLIIIPGIFSLVKNGLNLSIDFTGGSVVSLEKVSVEQSKLSEAFSSYSPIISQESETTYTVKTNEISQSQLDEVVEKIKKDSPDTTVVAFDSVGPVLGQETIKKTAIAIALASLLLLVHISRAFKQFTFGVSAILAMLHDSLVLLGIFSILGWKFGIETDVLFVTALLTVLSFSVHDTIVVYDRIRELKKRYVGHSLKDLANHAVSETMVRSLNNSLTIIFMLLSLVLLGGPTTKSFALALLIGSISGAYSSPFTAVPLLVIWDDLKNKKR